MHTCIYTEHITEQHNSRRQLNSMFIPGTVTVTIEDIVLIYTETESYHSTVISLCSNNVDVVLFGLVLGSSNVFLNVW